MAPTNLPEITDSEKRLLYIETVPRTSSATVKALATPSLKMRRLQCLLFSLSILGVLTVTIAMAQSRQSWVSISLRNCGQFQKLLNSENPKSLHGDLKEHPKDKLGHVVSEEDAAAMPLSQSNAEISRSLVELAKRLAPALNTTEAIGTAPLPPPLPTVTTSTTSANLPSTSLPTTVIPSTSVPSTPVPSTTLPSTIAPPVTSPTTVVPPTSSQATSVPAQQPPAQQPPPANQPGQTSPASTVVSASPNPAGGSPTNGPAPSTTVSSSPTPGLTQGQTSQGSLYVGTTTSFPSSMSSSSETISHNTALVPSTPTPNGKNSPSITRMVTSQTIYVTTGTNGATSTLTTVTVVPFAYQNPATRVNGEPSLQTNAARPMKKTGFSGALGVLGMVVVGAL